jgi:hypothetical protein
MREPAVCLGKILRSAPAIGAAKSAGRRLPQDDIVIASGDNQHLQQPLLIPAGLAGGGGGGNVLLRIRFAPLTLPSPS